MACWLQTGSTRPEPVPRSDRPRRTDRSIGYAGRGRPVGVNLSWPSDRSACSSAPPASRPGTTPLSVCPVAALPGFAPSGQESFFECVDVIWVLLVGLRPGAQMCEAQVLERAIDRVVGNRDAELFMQSHDQIARSPAHHAMDRRDRAFLHNPRKKRPVRVGQLARPPRRLIEPDHPGRRFRCSA
jgi:hypothetical protein